jgi:hypothetical protein
MASPARHRETVGKIQLPAVQGWGAEQLILATNRARRIERMHLLGNFGIISYELSRLSNEISQLKVGPYAAGTAEFENSKSAFGSSSELDYIATQNSKKQMVDYSAELKIINILDMSLIFLGTMQWGFGDVLLQYILV